MPSLRIRPVALLAFAGGAALACLCLAAPSHAAGFYIQEQSTRGAGRAFSGEAADTGPESLWWNPAAIASGGRQVYGSISGIFPSSDIDDRGSTLTFPGAPPVTVPVGGDPHASNPILDGLVVAGGFATPLNEHFSVGVGVTTPFNFVTDYKEDSFARYDGIKSRLITVDIQPTAAVKATPWLDLGVGIDVVYTSARLTQALPNLVPGAPDGFNDLHGDGWNTGWTVGGQVHSGDNWRVGVSWRSSVRHDLNGDLSVSGLLGPLAGANLSTQASASFRTPWILTFGGRFQVNDRLSGDLQIQRLGWSEFQTINISSPAGPTVIPERYQDTTTVAFGGDYAVNRALTLRAGAQWDPTPTPDVGRTLRVPDSNRWLISAGAEMKLSAAVTAEGALEYVDFLGSRVNNTELIFAGTPAQTAANYQADVSAHAIVASAGLRWRF